MNNLNRLLSLLVFFGVVVGLLGATMIVVQARGTQIGTETSVFLTARVQNRWLHNGNLHCESATLETQGQTYAGEITPGNWRGHSGNETCYIVFHNVPTPPTLTPAKVTVRYATLVGGESFESLPADRKQMQEKDYDLEVAWFDDHMVLGDMILGSASTGGAQDNSPTPTTVHLTARASNKWWVGGNLVCESATLETLGKTYSGAIDTGTGYELPGRDYCTIVFYEVLLPPGATPASILVTYYTLFADEVTEVITTGRLQTGYKNDTIQKAWGDSAVTMDEMILEDASTVPVIPLDPTALPTLPLPTLPTLP